MCGPEAQWIRHLTTNQEIPGSNPGGVDYISIIILRGRMKFIIFKRKIE